MSLDVRPWVQHVFGIFFFEFGDIAYIVPLFRDPFREEIIEKAIFHKYEELGSLDSRYDNPYYTKIILKKGSSSTDGVVFII